MPQVGRLITRRVCLLAPDTDGTPILLNSYVTYGYFMARPPSRAQVIKLQDLEVIESLGPGSALEGHGACSSMYAPTHPLSVLVRP